MKGSVRFKEVTPLVPGRVVSGTTGNIKLFFRWLLPLSASVEAPLPIYPSSSTSISIQLFLLLQIIPIFVLVAVVDKVKKYEHKEK